jgi:(1->4)-alpha-D-glucan 1-alpha-D-glucosylmutase
MPLDVEVTVPAGLIAFARTLGDRALVVVAPRLTASLCAPDHPFPIGPECWKTSRVILPPDLASRRYRTLFTGDSVEPTRTAAHSWIFAGDALRVLPVSILVSL